MIDLKSSPPKVLATLQAGRGASGVSINRAGTLALVANRQEGTVSVFSISVNSVTAAGKLDLGNENPVLATSSSVPTVAPRWSRVTAITRSRC